MFPLNQVTFFLKGKQFEHLVWRSLSIVLKVRRPWARSTFLVLVCFVSHAFEEEVEIPIRVINLDFSQTSFGVEWISKDISFRT